MSTLSRRAIMAETAKVLAVHDARDGLGLHGHAAHRVRPGEYDVRRA